MHDTPLEQALATELWADMQPQPAPEQLPLLAHYTSIRTLERIAQNPGNGALLVQPRDGVWTVTTADALRAFVDEGKGDLALGSVFGLAAPVPVVHPDESLESVLRRVGSRPFLP